MCSPGEVRTFRMLSSMQLLKVRVLWLIVLTRFLRAAYEQGVPLSETLHAL